MDLSVYLLFCHLRFLWQEVRQKKKQSCRCWKLMTKAFCVFYPQKVSLQYIYRKCKIPDRKSFNFPQTLRFTAESSHPTITVRSKHTHTHTHTHTWRRRDPAGCPAVWREDKQRKTDGCRGKRRETPSGEATIPRASVPPSPHPCVPAARRRGDGAGSGRPAHDQWED